MAKHKKPLLFVDSVPKGCIVNEQQIFKTPYVLPEDILEAHMVRTFDSGTASDLNKWIDEDF
jgi:hypothetical protein